MNFVGGQGHTPASAAAAAGWNLQNGAQNFAASAFSAARRRPQRSSVSSAGGLSSASATRRRPLRVLPAPQPPATRAAAAARAAALFPPQSASEAAPASECRYTRGVLMEALARLRRRDRKQFFAFAVDEKLVPDYRLVVSTPMSLDVMAKKVQEGAYKNFEAFDSDVGLIVSNCRLYNREETIFCKAAASLEASWLSSRERFRLKFKAAEAADARALARERVRRDALREAQTNQGASSPQGIPGGGAVAPEEAAASSCETQGSIDPSWPCAVRSIDRVSGCGEWWLSATDCVRADAGPGVEEKPRLSWAEARRAHLRLMRAASDPAAAAAVRAAEKEESASSQDPNAADAAAQQPHQHQQPQGGGGRQPSVQDKTAPPPILTVPNTAQGNPFYWAEFLLPDVSRGGGGFGEEDEGGVAQSTAESGPASALNGSSVSGLRFPAEYPMPLPCARGPGNRKASSQLLPYDASVKAFAKAAGAEALLGREAEEEGERQEPPLLAEKDSPPELPLCSRRRLCLRETTKAPLSDLRVFGLDTADFADYNSRLHCDFSLLLGVGPSNVASAATLIQPLAPAGEASLAGRQRRTLGVCTDVLAALCDATRGAAFAGNFANPGRMPQQQHAPHAQKPPQQQPHQQPPPAAFVAPSLYNAAAALAARQTQGLSAAPAQEAAAALASAPSLAVSALASGGGGSAASVSKKQRLAGEGTGGGAVGVSRKAGVPPHLEVLYDVLLTQQPQQQQQPHLPQQQPHHPQHLVAPAVSAQQQQRSPAASAAPSLRPFALPAQPPSQLVPTTAQHLSLARRRLSPNALVKAAPEAGSACVPQQPTLAVSTAATQLHPLLFPSLGGGAPSPSHQNPLQLPGAPLGQTRSQ